MSAKIVVVILLATSVLATPADVYGPSGHEQPPTPYNFAYGVQDEYAGTDFSQTEESDGNTVKGSYTVQLPDGRKQTVTYVADPYSGYKAEVSYYGEAQYPREYGPPITFKPQSYQPQPTYQQPGYQ